MFIGHIKRCQRKYGVAKIQRLIDTGEAFSRPGHIRDMAWSMVKSGACMLPRVILTEYNGRKIPARQMLEPGCSGTFQNCNKYWEEFVGKLNSVV